MSVQIENLIEELFLSLPSLKDKHARTTDVYGSYAQKLRFSIEPLFRSTTPEKVPFGPIGKITFPYFKMGNKDSLDLFDLDEFIIFSFYWANRAKYKKVIDIGANIGLHSLVLAKCGYEVRSFEPDPFHFKQLEYVLKINQVNNVQPYCGAVSCKSGQAEFVRVLGNTTSSHLAGCKNPYGGLERFSVKLFNIQDLIRGADLIKMDVEGHENEIILATKGADWEKTDAMLEIGSIENAKLIYEHLTREGVHLFSQKTNWQKAKKVEDVPTSYKEGSLFISKKPAMPWG